MTEVVYVLYMLVPMIAFLAIPTAAAFMIIYGRRRYP